MTTNLPSLNNTKIPAYLQARMGQQSAIVAAALTGGGGGGVPRISIKQSRFRLIEDGVETPLDSLHLDCAIVDVVPGVSKTFYLKPYNPGDEPTAPDCSSLLGDKPAPNSPAPQSETCAECPMNAWGSKLTPAGKETKACADTRRIAVVPADDPAGTMYLFIIPAASMASFKSYIKELGMRGIDPSVVRTRVTFDASSDYPKLQFQFAGFLDEEGATTALGRVRSVESQDVVGMLSAPTAAPALAAPKPAPAPVAAAPKPAPAPAPKPAAPVVESNVPPPAAAKGFGKKPAAAPAPAPQAAPQPAPVVVAEGSEGLSALESQLDAMLNG